MYGALNFSIRVEISSYPPVFLDFKDFNNHFNFSVDETKMTR